MRQLHAGRDAGARADLGMNEKGGVPRGARNKACLIAAGCVPVAVRGYVPFAPKKPVLVSMKKASG